MYKCYIWLEVHRRLLKCTNIIFDLRYRGCYWKTQILYFTWGTKEATECTNITFDLRYTGGYWNIQISYLTWGTGEVSEMYKYYIWLEVQRQLLKCTNIIYNWIVIMCLNYFYNGCNLNLSHNFFSF